MKPSGQATLSGAEAPFATPAVVSGLPDVPALVSKVGPGVVNITATQEVRIPEGLVGPFEFFFGPGPRGERPPGREEIVKRRGLGSGFLYDGRGHVVTNAHVVADASTVRVTLADEREFDAKVRGRDERLDLAVLELQGAKDLPHVALGRSDELLVGDYVVAIGNPFGLGHTVTMGIVSAKGRELGAGPYDDFIQTDASINPGNSGGPLFNLRGEVVGISTAMAPTAQGIGFAIPIDAVKDVVPQLLEKGKVTRGKLGLVIQDMDAPLARALGLAKPNGALVGDVEPGSAADRGGVKAGEVIVEADQIAIAHAHDLPRLIARRAPGTRVTLKVLGKNGAMRTVQVTLDELRDNEEKESLSEQKPGAGSGSSVAGRGTFGLELGAGEHGEVIVRGVDASSPAAEKVRPGDVILEVNGKSVASTSEAANRIRETPSDRPLLVKLKRDGRSAFVAIERK